MLDPNKLDILLFGPIAEGTINQQTKFVHIYRGQRKQKFCHI